MHKCWYGLGTRPRFLTVYSVLPVSGAEDNVSSQKAAGDKFPPRKPLGKKERREERRKTKQGYGLGMETKLVWEQLRRWAELPDVSIPR